MADLAPVYLACDEVCAYLQGQWDALVEAVEQALKSFSCGGVVQPVRAAVSIQPHDGTLLAMPAYYSEKDALATKVVTIFPANKTRGLPNIQAVVLLYSATTGSLKAILDGLPITTMRTAAASAVATKYLAREGSEVLAILGAGVQARSHYQVLNRMYRFKKVCVWNIHKDTAEALVAEILRNGGTAEYCDTVMTAVKDADIIVTVTMSHSPVLKKELVKAGAHINAVGAPAPNMQEISEELMRSSVVYVDSRAAAAVESGDVIKSGAAVYAEIGEVISGTKEAFPGKTTIFKSLGMAVEDVVAAELVFKQYEKAKAEGIPRHHTT